MYVMYIILCHVVSCVMLHHIMYVMYIINCIILTTIIAKCVLQSVKRALTSVLNIIS